jgi:carboxymethylenebutenolidase
MGAKVTRALAQHSLTSVVTSRCPADMIPFSPMPLRGGHTAMQKRTMEEVWRLHTDAEFMEHDVEGALATMTDDAFVMNLLTGMGGRGKKEIRAFYRDSFVNSLPDDIAGELRHRVVGENAIVDEIHHTFTHTKQMDWILPGVPPTNKKVAIDIVAVVYFRDERISGERIYWDHAQVLRQVGLLAVEENYAKGAR